jgi:hypothetical protein
VSGIGDVDHESGMVMSTEGMSMRVHHDGSGDEGMLMMND